MAPQLRSADIAKEVADNIKTLGKGVVKKWNDLENSFEEEWNRDLHDQPFQFWVLDTQLLPLSIVRLVAQFRYSEKRIPLAIEEKIESITHKYGLESRWDLAFYLGSWKSFTSRRTLEAILAFRKSTPDTCLRDLLRAVYKIRDDRLRSKGKGAEKSLFSFSPSDVIAAGQGVIAEQRRAVGLSENTGAGNRNPVDSPRFSDVKSDIAASGNDAKLAAGSEKVTVAEKLRRQNVESEPLPAMDTAKEVRGPGLETDVGPAVGTVNGEPERNTEAGSMPLAESIDGGRGRDSDEEALVAANMPGATVVDASRSGKANLVAGTPASATGASDPDGLDMEYSDVDLGEDGDTDDGSSVMSVEQPRGIPANELQPIYESPFIMNTPILKTRNGFGMENGKSIQSRKEHSLDLVDTDNNDDSSVALDRENWLSIWKDSWVLVSVEAKVQRKDIERLGEGEWLGDEIINSCTEAITREANPKVSMMNSLKFASVEKAIPTGRLRLGKYHTRLAESRYFVVPVHQGGNHWSLGIIISDGPDKPQATVLTVDSLDKYGNKANKEIQDRLNHCFGSRGNPDDFIRRVKHGIHISVKDPSQERILLFNSLVSRYFKVGVGIDRRTEWGKAVTDERGMYDLSARSTGQILDKVVRGSVSRFGTDESYHATPSKRTNSKSCQTTRSIEEISQSDFSERSGNEGGVFADDGESRKVDVAYPLGPLGQGLSCKESDREILSQVFSDVALVYRHSAALSEAEEDMWRMLCLATDANGFSRVFEAHPLLDIDEYEMALGTGNSAKSQGYFARRKRDDTLKQQFIDQLDEYISNQNTKRGTIIALQNLTSSLAMAFDMAVNERYMPAVEELKRKIGVKLTLHEQTKQGGDFADHSREWTEELLASAKRLEDGIAIEMAKIKCVERSKEKLISLGGTMSVLERRLEKDVRVCEEAREAFVSRVEKCQEGEEPRKRMKVLSISSPFSYIKGLKL